MCMGGGGSWRTSLQKHPPPSFTVPLYLTAPMAGACAAGFSALHAPSVDAAANIRARWGRCIVEASLQVLWFGVSYGARRRIGCSRPLNVVDSHGLIHSEIARRRTRMKPEPIAEWSDP